MLRDVPEEESDILVDYDGPTKSYINPRKFDTPRSYSVRAEVSTSQIFIPEDKFFCDKPGFKSMKLHVSKYTLN